MWKGFQKFLHQAREPITHGRGRTTTDCVNTVHDSGMEALQDAADIEEIILMWTVNFGLNLNETTEQGPRSISLLSEIRDAPRRWS